MSLSDWVLHDFSSGAAGFPPDTNGRRGAHAGAELSTNQLINSGTVSDVYGEYTREYYITNNPANSQNEQFHRQASQWHAAPGLEGGTFVGVPNTQAILVQGLMRTKNYWDPAFPIEGFNFASYWHQRITSVINPYLTLKDSGPIGGQVHGNGYKLVLGNNTGGYPGFGPPPHWAAPGVGGTAYGDFGLRIVASPSWSAVGAVTPDFPGLGVGYQNALCAAPPGQADYAVDQWYNCRLTCTPTPAGDLLEAFVDATYGAGGPVGGTWGKVGELTVAPSDPWYTPWGNAAYGNGFGWMREAVSMSHDGLWDGGAMTPTPPGEELLDELAWIDCVRLAVRTI